MLAKVVFLWWLNGNSESRNSLKILFIGGFGGVIGENTENKGK